MNVLVAGIGNVLFGDDGFGVAVVERLRATPLPSGVTARDFGIRGIDLGYAIADGVETAILVDAVRRGGDPGTLYLIEPDWTDGTRADGEWSPHTLDPRGVLGWAEQLGTRPRVLLVGCEPESFGTEDGQPGRLGLSARVEAAIPEALRLIETLVERIVQSEGVDHAA
jgi:hydrogenase maturation protease